MKKVYCCDLELDTTLYADRTETICVTKGNEIVCCYYVVINPQFRQHDTNDYVLVFEGLCSLINYFTINATSKRYENSAAYRIFSEREYVEWFNKLEW